MAVKRSMEKYLCPVQPRKPEGPEPGFSALPFLSLAFALGVLLQGCKTIWVGWVDKKPEEEAGPTTHNNIIPCPFLFCDSRQELQDFFKDCGKIVEAVRSTLYRLFFIAYAR